MFKAMKPGNKYFVINTDEPYAKALYEVLKAGQIAKGEWPEGDITFEEWLKTFPVHRSNTTVIVKPYMGMTEDEKRKFMSDIAYLINLF